MSDASKIWNTGLAPTCRRPDEKRLAAKSEYGFPYWEISFPEVTGPITGTEIATAHEALERAHDNLSIVMRDANKNETRLKKFANELETAERIVRNLCGDKSKEECVRSHFRGELCR